MGVDCGLTLSARWWNYATYYYNYTQHMTHWILICTRLTRQKYAQYTNTDWKSHMYIFCLTECGDANIALTHTHTHMLTLSTLITPYIQTDTQTYGQLQYIHQLTTQCMPLDKRKHCAKITASMVMHYSVWQLSLYFTSLKVNLTKN